MLFNKQKGTKIVTTVHTSPGAAPAANELMAMATSLAERAEEIAQATETKLVVIAREVPEDEQKKTRESRWFPPLFCKLRESLFRIEDSLEQIQGVVNRTEL